ncbi:MAG: AMP-binding protein, partial [Candidatus Stygibacter frigidus]|nr:AMP-binding protein [Candidatus Stygibacter frigidus]
MINDNYVRYFADSIKGNWELNALSDYNGKTLTYGQIGRQIAALHKIFKATGIEQGDKIALIGGNTVNWAIVYLTAITYGAVIVPILPDFHAEDIQHIVNHSDAVLLFISKYHYEQVDEELIPDLGGIIQLDDFTVLHERKRNLKSSFSHNFAKYLYSPDYNPTPDELCFEKITNKKLASIVYTSGTTGLSKGVMLSHNCMLANLLYARANMPLNRGDHILSFLPLAHA